MKEALRDDDVSQVMFSDVDEQTPASARTRGAAHKVRFSKQTGVPRDLRAVATPPGVHLMRQIAALYSVPN
jgi:hypothetical protein